MNRLRNIIAEFFPLSLYGVYLYSGLALLLPAIAGPAIGPALRTSLVPMAVNWSTSIYVLALANCMQAARIFGLRFAVLFVLSTSTVVIAAEQVGLLTGCVFGDYHFPANGLEGPRLFGNLPLLVMALWHCLLFPCFMIGLSISRSLLKDSSAKGVVLASSIFLTFFDAFSEPVSANLGHRAWAHAADFGTLSLYERRPDWLFNSHLDNVNSYEGVPFQNSVGWLITGLLCYWVGISVAGIPKFSIGLSAVTQSSPALVNCATALYYAAHPIHPSLVRFMASLYILIVVISGGFRMYYLKSQEGKDM